MEKYFKVTFRAQLIKFALAFKAESEIDIFWKKGMTFLIQAKKLLSQKGFLSLNVHPNSTKLLKSIATWHLITLENASNPKL